MPSTDARLAFYRFMHRLPLPRSYAGKFLLVAFVGVHVPLLAVVFFLTLTRGDWNAAFSLLLLMLGATVVGTAATLWLQLRLLEPVLRTAAALEAYRARREDPDLPTGYRDEAGTLMRRAQACVRELDELISFRTALLRVMAHDLRGMVTSASLSSQLMRMELESPSPDPSALRELNAVVEESGARQAALIADIMGMAASEEGRLEVSRRDTELRPLLERVAALLRVRAEEKGVAVRVGAPEGLEASLDGPKVQQIVQNLADNALKFTRRGGEVALEAEVVGGEARIRVVDDGVGMSPEVRAGLFQPFTAGQRSGTDREAGTGLGLWICQVLVEAHEGSIRVESEEGLGTTMEIRIPVPLEERPYGSLELVGASPA